MPELPEVETIRKNLIPKICRKVIADVVVLEPKQFIGNKNLIIQGLVEDITRRGKILTIKIKKPGKNFLYLNIHLKMSGQLLYAENKDNAVYKNIIPKTNSFKLPTTTTRVIIIFSDNSALFFNDLRKFGWIKISRETMITKGTDVLSPEFTLEKLGNLIKSVNKPIKVFLMDQSMIAGIGNIYANDALFIAGIDPQRKTQSLSHVEIKRLFKSINKVIKEGLKLRGSSAKDESYILPDGSRGSYQKHFRVYERENQPCLVCQKKIKRIKQGGRSTYFCPNCQK